MADPEGEARRLAGERGYLYVYALTHLRDADLAEDAVQECLAAGLAALPRFEGRAALRTWLVAILRRKMVDLVRRRGREIPVAEPLEDAPDAPSPWFDAAGHWAAGHTPQPWRDPEADLARAEFLEVLRRCVDSLPQRTAQVFMLREVLGERIEVICESLAVSRGNCSVMLHRARLRLRECLEARWFGGAR